MTPSVWWRSLAVGALWLVLGACSRQGPPEDPAFQARWRQVTAANEALIVGDEPGLALSANVRRAEAKLDRPPARSGALPEQPRGDEVAQVIRSNLGAVKGCYASAARRSGRSGKAIVTFTIGSDGRPTNVQVDAPSFKDTGLPTCLTAQVSFWSFPRSRKGAGAVSYPFVFVGG
jgi:TonB family protein